MIHLKFYKKDPSEKIKEATLKLLAEEGYDAISMRKIAREANVALGQLTYYYKTKSGLIVLVVKEVLDMFYDEFSKKVDSSKDKIETIINGIESVLNEDTKVEKLLITIISQAQFNKKLQKLLSEFWSRITSLINKSYMDEYGNIDENQANIKARLLIGAAIESIVEKILGFDDDSSSSMTLIRAAQEKLGE